MDEYSGKRANDGVVVPRKRMTHVFRDTANTRDQNGQLCSRLGCSSRVNSPKSAQIGYSEKGKSLRSSIRPSSKGKEAIGSSSRTVSGTNNPEKSLTVSRKTLSSRLETGLSETSSVQDDPLVSKLIPPPEIIQRGLQGELEIPESSNKLLMEVGSSSVVSNTNTRSRRNFHQKPALRGHEVKSSGPLMRGGSSSYGLRNLRCNSISDVIPAGCSSSDSSLNRRKDMIKKRNCGGESSSTGRGKKMVASPLEGRNPGSRNGISISDSRRSRNIPAHRDNNIVSVRTRRSVSGHARGRLSSLGNESPMSSNESPIMIPPLPHSGDLTTPGLSLHTSSETPLSHPSSYSRPSTGVEQLCGVIPPSPTEYGITRSLINRGSFRRYNMDGIAEVLLALERIEQDDDLTHEQILLLETSLFLNGLNFYDQHRDMRLDIDNMSYEELLALEESMGSVSTALTEEELSECLKRSIYLSAHSEDATESCNENKDDIKCSVCQEEYVVGDEVGSLKCEHGYHVVCIQQWLRLKNWCPICKASAAPPNSSSPS